MSIATQTLNPEQLAAIQQIEGPITIIAGPGSGKTRVLTSRIAHLLNSGVMPKNILALTFTNKAATEMKTRVHKITNNQDVFSIWMGTFHSVFAKILRQESEFIGYTNNFTIYDNEDSIKIIRRIIKDKNLDPEIYNPKYIYSRISIFKNQLIDYDQYRKEETLLKQDQINKRDYFSEIYREYSNICQQSNCMDFDDLLMNTYILFQENNQILEKYQSIFKYILIDEYQDTNKAQDQIIKQIGNKYKNICVVGDDSQSIYSFRGANITNILEFKKFYTNTKEFKLEQNYRSTKNIVKAANILIANNTQKIKKTIFSNNENGDDIKLNEYYNEREEGVQIANQIKAFTQSGRTNLSEYAILYRINSQSKALEDGLRKNRIGYRIFGGLSFYQRKEIKDVIAFLKLIVNHNDNESLIRIINYPTRGIGAKTIDKIRHQAEKKKTSIWSLLNSSRLNELKLTNNVKNKILVFNEILSSLFENNTKSVFQITEKLMKKTGIIQKLKDDPSPENISKLENIGELINSIKIFSMRPTNNTLSDFISDISLDQMKSESNKLNQNYVSMMTIHQAKGLEFPYVYIVGLEDGLFPSKRNMNQDTLLEEERRLLYVGLTRAIKKITLSYAVNRFQFGISSKSKKSLFLDDIDSCLFKKTHLYSPKINYTTRLKPPKLGLKKLKKIRQDFYIDPRNLKTGMIIKHNIFGLGEVAQINTRDGNEKMTVLFRAHGKKVLLTKFAKFKIIK